MLIHVDDVNDNFPIFEQLEYLRVVPERATDFQPSLVIEVPIDQFYYDVDLVIASSFRQVIVMVLARAAARSSTPFTPLTPTPPSLRSTPLQARLICMNIVDAAQAGHLLSLVHRADSPN